MTTIKQMFRILGLLAFGIGSPVLFDCNLADNAIYAFYSTLASFWVPMVTLLALSFRSYRFRKDLVDFNRKASVFASPVILARNFFETLNIVRSRRRSSPANIELDMRSQSELGTANSHADSVTILDDLESGTLDRNRVTTTSDDKPPLPPRPPHSHSSRRRTTRCRNSGNCSTTSRSITQAL